MALQLVPWKRALFLLEQGAADFTTTLAFSSERERFLHYSRSTEDIYLYWCKALNQSQGLQHPR